MERRRGTASRWATSSPSSRMRPLLGSTIRLTMRMSVVLPQPEDPSRTVVVPAAILALKDSTAAGLEVPEAPGSRVPRVSR